MRDFLKRTLSLSGIDVDEEDLVNVEAQVMNLNSAETLIKELHIKDVLPVIVFRAEEENE